MDITRLQEMGSLLFAHGRDANFGIMPIGTIELVRIDESKKRLIAIITFDEDEKSQTICEKVRKKILKGISIGYCVYDWEEVKYGEKSKNGRFDGECCVAIKWQPYEISIEPIPADPSVGIGRNQKGENVLIMGNQKNEGTKNIDSRINDISEPVVIDEGSIRQQGIKDENKRVIDINTLCKKFNMDSEEFIKNGTLIDDVQRKILEKLTEENKPIEGNLRVLDAMDKFKAAATDALMLKGGLRVENLSDGANELRNLSLRELAKESLKRQGIINDINISDDDLYVRSVSPDSQFLSIISNSINKTLSSYGTIANTTYQRWVGKGSATNFKASEHYRLSEANKLELVPQNGEIKFSQNKDEKITKKIVTYGRQFGFSRQALINDDIGLITKVPESYIRAAYRTVNTLVYEMLGNNPKIYDDTSLFTTNHKNLITITGLDITNLAKIKKAMRLQTNLKGEETLNIIPNYIIVPAELEIKAMQLINSLSDPNSSNSNVINPFNKSMELIVEPELDKYSTESFYLAANSIDCEHIEVTYLNGNESPILQQIPIVDNMSVKWNCIYDLGITVVDFRGIAKGNK